MNNKTPKQMFEALSLMHHGISLSKRTHSSQLNFNTPLCVLTFIPEKSNGIELEITQEHDFSYTCKFVNNNIKKQYCVPDMQMCADLITDYLKCNFDINTIHTLPTIEEMAIENGYI